VWHQPPSAAELVALLDKLGVGEASREAGDFSGVAGAPLPAPAEPTPSPAEPVPAEASRFTGIWWGLGGLAGGVLLTVFWMRRSQADTDASPDPDNEHAETP
jgi:hypothetical protein